MRSTARCPLDRLAPGRCPLARKPRAFAHPRRCPPRRRQPRSPGPKSPRSPPPGNSAERPAHPAADARRLRAQGLRLRRAARGVRLRATRRPRARARHRPSLQPRRHARFAGRLRAQQARHAAGAARHGKKCSHIEQVGPRLNWPCVRVNFATAAHPACARTTHCACGSPCSPTAHRRTAPRTRPTTGVASTTTCMRWWRGRKGRGRGCTGWGSVWI